MNTKTKSKEVVVKEVADIEFGRFIDAMDIDADPAFMDEVDLTAFEKTKRRLVAAIQDSSLVINEKGEAVYTPKNTPDVEAITFHQRTGASAMAMDGTKLGHDMKKTYKVMADMTRAHPSVFAKLIGLDIKICEGIFALLMD